MWALTCASHGHLIRGDALWGYLAGPAAIRSAPPGAPDRVNVAPHSRMGESRWTSTATPAQASHRRRIRNLLPTRLAAGRATMASGE